MAINKVIFGNETLIDLTQDTVSANNMLAGTTAHGANGDPIVGNLITHNVIDNLTSTSTADALSANQGRVLKEMIDTKGGGGSVIRITCPEDYVGNTITFAMVGIDTQSAVVGADLVVEFTSTELGTATVTNADTEDSFSFEIDTYSLYERGFSMYGYEGWLESASIPDTFGSLEAVLQSETTLRTLFTKHASVDYLVEWLSEDADTADTILNTDLVAKWVNLRDYALDSLWAVAEIKSVMDTADKYGYGEWVLIDDVWQPKGNVPIMTSNSAPYGTISVSSTYSTLKPWDAFGNSESNYWGSNDNDTNANFTYKFVNPIILRRTYWCGVGSGSSIGRLCTIKIQGSNDGTNFDTIETFENIGESDLEEKYIDSVSNVPYLYLRVQFEGTNWVIPTGGRAQINKLQFYGRELKVSVPTMTSNTSPWGSTNHYQVFDGNASTNASDTDFTYDFGNSVVPKYFVSSANGGTLQGSNDGVVWTDIPTPSSNTVAYSRLRVHYASSTSVHTIQFYALDYSEHTERHWIYDHGVELETIGISRGNCEKTDNGIKVGSSSESTGTIGMQNTIDTTPYTLERVEVSQSNLANGNTKHYVIVIDTLTTRVTKGQNTISEMPYNCYLDITNINGQNTPAYQVEKTDNEDLVVAMWLE